MAFTAFGERKVGTQNSTSTRFGYVGSFGYQASGEYPFLHVGARYYDPATGRFLQRDPIGMRGGLNVYSYVGARPTRRIDASGLEWFPQPVDQWPPEPPAREPIAESPEDIAKDLKRERNRQIFLGACIGVVGLFNPVGAVIALVVDLGAASYANEDPIVVPTNPPKTAPKPPGGGAG